MTKQFLLVLLAGLALAGCSRLPKLDKVLPDSRTEYRKSRTMPDLEVPPDLTTDSIKDRMAIPEGGESATYSTYQERIAQRKHQRELERSANDAIKVLDNEHILAVQGAPKQVWPQLRKFMTESKYKLELDDEDLGVIETVWDEDPEALTRQKFKVFAEPGREAGTTVLYVSLRAEALVPKGGQRVWQPKERDPAQERDFVSRLQAYLVGAQSPVVASGATAAAATSTAAAGTAAAASAGGKSPSDLTVAEAYGTGSGASATPVSNSVAEVVTASGGKTYLSIHQPLDQAWKNTSVALERAGYAVDEADQARGLYFVRVPSTEGAVHKRGLLSKLKFWGKDEDHRLQVSLTSVGTRTEAVVLDHEGRWETGEVAGKILAAIARGLEAKSGG